jgi:hypothetical protein
MRNSFNPSEVTLLANVVDEACLKLGQTDIETRRSIAARVVSYAGQGECEYAALLALALNGKASVHVA